MRWVWGGKKSNFALLKICYPENCGDDTQIGHLCQFVMIFGLSNLHGSFLVSVLASKNVAYMWMGKREQTQQKISADRVDDIKISF